MHLIRRARCALLASVLVAACSSNDASTADSTTAVRASAAGRPAACTLVTAAEMSAILGVAVVAVPDDSSGGKTGCMYQPPAGPGATAKVEVDWGGGEAAMTTLAAMGRKIPPGVDNPYAGIGDEIAMSGAGLLIRIGEDLLNLELTGAEDAPRKARRIFEAAKPRM